MSPEHGGSTADSDRSGTLLAAGRQSIIVDYVTERGTARVRDLAVRFGVSDMTIRRDIDALADSGAVEKVHGGAKLPGRLSRDEPGFSSKQSRQAGEKRAIASAAIELVSPGMVIGLSAGTTTFAFAEQLHRVAGLTIITNSLKVADQFEPIAGGRPYNGSVLVTGGERTPSDALVGPIGVSALRSLHVDLLFLGVHGAHPRAGYTTPNLLESELNQVFLEASERVAVLADHTKWGLIGMSAIAALEAADVYITDDGIPDDARALLEDRVGDLVVARAS
jgi:DeoR/GlpR family transcriptional regulator of sugar metabolism